jgi:glutathione S-transferase
LRPAGKKDPFGVEQAKEGLIVAYGIVDNAMSAKTWAMGDAFTMADCAAGPALHYANMVVPFGENVPHAAAYLARLKERPSFARALKEAEPYLSLFPK